ncbi:MAG: hypothetical protein IPI42_06560 [Saprospiraceae bacterium]|nr:hypothetical protein [Candidatus Parvibacillus calidus]
MIRFQVADRIIAIRSLRDADKPRIPHRSSSYRYTGHTAGYRKLHARACGIRSGKGMDRGDIPPLVISADSIGDAAVTEGE